MNLNNTQHFFEKLKVFFINKNEIKLRFITIYSIIIITKEDKFYEFKRNSVNNWLIALWKGFTTTDLKVEEAIVSALCNKGIIEIKYSRWHTIARTHDGKIFCWGRNIYGIIGNGNEDENKYEPTRITLEGKYVTQISCGFRHLLVLTKDDKIFGWGCNEQGQIGMNDKAYSSTPYNISELNGKNIISIECGSKHSMALTKQGLVYSWGSNKWGQLGRDKATIKCHIPHLIELGKKTKVKKISCGKAHSILLTNDGTIYIFGSNKYGAIGIGSNNTKMCDPQILKPLKLCFDIASHYAYHFSASRSDKDLYYVWGMCGENSHKIIKSPELTKFKSFNEIFFKYFGITFELFDDKVTFTDKFLKNLRKDYYINRFKEIEILDQGSFGPTVKVERKITKLEEPNEEKNFAIKRMTLNIKKDSNAYTIFKELENFFIFKEIRDQRIVKYFDLWLEKSTDKNHNISEKLFIQMELCDKTLLDVISDMKNEINLFDQDSLTSLGYYIASEIFIEILQGVNYLHKRNPPIIHRNLKPKNILLKIGNKSGNVIKIADLGLACLHEYKNQNHTRDRGSKKYAAVEVLNGKNYDTRADIFSLGIILVDLFQIDLNRDYNENNGDFTLLKKYREISKLCDTMTQIKVYKRPDNLEKILYEKDNWSLSNKDPILNEEYRNFKETKNNSFIKELSEILYKPLLEEDKKNITNVNEDAAGQIDSVELFKNLLNTFQLLAQENSDNQKQYDVVDIIQLFETSENLMSKLDDKLQEEYMSQISINFKLKIQWFILLLECLPDHIAEDNYSKDKLRNFCSFFQRLINRKEYSDIRRDFKYIIYNINSVLKQYRYDDTKILLDIHS